MAGMAGRQRAHAGWVHPVSTACPTGKWCFASRKHAKTYLRQNPELAGNREYPCPEEGCVYWHIGHLPPAVVKGRLDRAVVDHRVRVPKA